MLMANVIEMGDLMSLVITNIMYNPRISDILKIRFRWNWAVNSEINDKVKLNSDIALHLEPTV